MNIFLGDESTGEDGQPSPNDRLSQDALHVSFSSNQRSIISDQALSAGGLGLSFSDAQPREVNSGRSSGLETSSSSSQTRGARSDSTNAGFAEGQPIAIRGGRPNSATARFSPLSSDQPRQLSGEGPDSTTPDLSADRLPTIRAPRPDQSISQFPDFSTARPRQVNDTIASFPVYHSRGFGDRGPRARRDSFSSLGLSPSPPPREVNSERSGGLNAFSQNQPPAVNTERQGSMHDSSSSNQWSAPRGRGTSSRGLNAFSSNQPRGRQRYRSASPDDSSSSSQASAPYMSIYGPDANSGSSVNQPSISQPSMNQPSMGHPSMNQPSMNQHSTSQPREASSSGTVGREGPNRQRSHGTANRRPLPRSANDDTATENTMNANSTAGASGGRRDVIQDQQQSTPTQAGYGVGESSSQPTPSVLAPQLARYGQRKPKVEGLVDYGLSDNFDADPSKEVPDKLVDGGVIHDRPVLPGDANEEIDEEEKARRAEAQKTKEEDEEMLKAGIEANKKNYDDGPTAEDAEKARNGMSKEEFAKKMNIDVKTLEENEKTLDALEKARARMSEEELAVFGIKLDLEYLQTDPKDQDDDEIPESGEQERVPYTADFFANLGDYPEIIMEIAKYLRPKDLVLLFSMSLTFNETIKGFFSHTMLTSAAYHAPESARIFPFKFYADLCVLDPAGRPHPMRPWEVRMVPSPRWLKMVVHREKTIRDILAMMAREGHRMPSGMGLSLKKMWLLMDVSTSAQRVQLLHSPFFTGKDLYNMQMFFVKLDMRFNDPIDGPGDDALRKLMLGQRSLTTLCKLLKREICRDPVDIIKMAVRYAYRVVPQLRGLPMFGIPPQDIGTGHLEGWGKGRVHLLRPDELVIRESVRRGLGLKDHIMGMFLWGYVDPMTGLDIEVTEEEMYMSEDEDQDSSSDQEVEEDERMDKVVMRRLLQKVMNRLSEQEGGKQEGGEEKQERSEETGNGDVIMDD